MNLFSITSISISVIVLFKIIQKNTNIIQYIEKYISNDYNYDKEIQEIIEMTEIEDNKDIYSIEEENYNTCEEYSEGDDYIDVFN